MADYFPLVSRAVASLDPNTRDRREAMYVRAREALDRQLLSLDPPISPTDLARERAALAETIARVEAQYAAPRPITPPVPAKPVEPAVAPPRVPSAKVETAPEKPRLIDPTENEPLVVPQRPKMDAKANSRGFGKNRFAMTALAVGIPVLLTIGGAAYLLRDDPSRYSGQQADGSGTDPQQSPPRKSDGRLDGTGAGPNPAGPRPQPAPTDRPALPVAARVLFFEETGTDPRGSQSDGQVVWRVETSAAAAGRPADTLVRGTISIPNANMSIDMMFKRNRDASLPASHTVEVIFNPAAGRDGVKVIGPIEARDQETSPGYALKGAMVPVGTNLFLVGLDNNEQAIARNLDALRDQKWFAFQFQLENNKLGAVLIEKGQTGERVFAEALAAWKR